MSQLGAFQTKVELTSEQQRFMAHNPKTHARLEAGPGTGKSFTLVAYLDSLLNQPDAPRVRLLTFTRAATAELAEKLEESPTTQALRPSTVHSFAISVLLRNPGTGRFPEPLRIADSWEDDRIVLETLKVVAGFSKNRLKVDLRPKMEANWESLEVDPDFDVPGSEKARFLGAWEEHRRILGYTLLGELPYRLLKALEEHADLEGLGFDLLLVDEYQDLNACDLGLLKHLADRGSAIIAAGDSDQSIYGWRHADPSGLGRFTTEYPEAQDYPLTITMRCGSQIIGWANHVISGDSGRRQDRPVLTPRPGSPPGNVGLFRFANNSEEVEGVCQIVERLLSQHDVAPADILILHRGDHNRVFSSPIREELEHRGISCSDPSFVKEVLSRDENRRFIAAFRLVVNPEDSLSWAAHLHLTPGVGPAFFQYVYDYAQRNNLTFAQALLKLDEENFKDWPSSSKDASHQIFRVRYWLEGLRLPPSQPDGGWADWLDENAGEFNCDQDLSNLLSGVAERLDDPELGQLLAQLEPLGKDIAQTKSEGVRIMTMAASKGLTVRATILPALDDSIIPNPSVDEREERRLLYVAMTRAKEFLYCTWAQRRTGPSARAGQETFGRRTYCHFLNDGPVKSVAWRA